MKLSKEQCYSLITLLACYADLEKTVKGMAKYQSKKIADEARVFLSFYNRFMDKGLNYQNGAIDVLAWKRAFDKYSAE